MKTSEMTELQLFHDFVTATLKNGGQDLSLDQAIQAFRDYQQELMRLRQQVQPALERSLREESKPFDLKKLKARVTQELARKGITE